MNIKQKIKERGFTLEQVRKAMQPEMSQQSISALLRSDNPGVKKLREIADIIGVTLSELVADEPAGGVSLVCPHCGEPLRVSVS